MTAIVRPAAAGQSVSWTFVRAGDDLHQLNEITAVQRKVLHGFCGYGGAYGCAVSLKQGVVAVTSTTADLAPTWRWTSARARSPASTPRSLVIDSWNPAGLNRDRVVSDGKEREGIVARGVGLDGALVVGSEVGEGNGGIWDTGARLVRHRAKNVRSRQLR